MLQTYRRNPEEKEAQIIEQKKLWMEQGPTGGDKKQNQENALERER